MTKIVKIFYPSIARDVGILRSGRPCSAFGAALHGEAVGAYCLCEVAGSTGRD